MNSLERRNKILKRLVETKSPVSASNLAGELQVSRQIIVGDVALLRSAGHRILATPRGYLLEQEVEGIIKTIAVSHGPDKTETELNCMVDNGCTVLDVIIEHPVYGQLTGPLQISNRYEVKQFLKKSKGAVPLSYLTGGIHLHTLSCPDEEAYKRVLAELSKEGILLEESGK